jgi:hypothetical protein
MLLMAMGEEQDRQSLADAIDAATNDYEYMSGRHEIVGWYQDTYGASWRQHIVSALVGQTGRSRETVAREFQRDKKTGRDRWESQNIRPATREKYQKLGKTLPLKKVPKNLQGKRAGVEFKGKLWFSGKPYYKDIQVALDDEQTASLLEGNLEAAIEAYGIDTGNLEDYQIDSVDITLF